MGVDGRPPLLDELVTRSALADLARSAHRMFQLPVRLLSTTGVVLASAGHPCPVQALLDTLPARLADIDEAPCNWNTPSRTWKASTRTGQELLYIELVYNQRRIGWISAGPYLSPDESSPPAALIRQAAYCEPDSVQRAWERVPRARDAEVAEIGGFLASVIDLMLFSGHKALVASQMHLASVHESYRELCEKNERLEQAYDQLKELDRLKSNFLATISHELRTPLTSIMGYGEMLGEGVAGPLNPEQKEFVGTIRAKSEQLLGLIVTLLDFSKLENGKLTVRLDPVPIAQVIDEAASILLPAALKKGIALTTAMEPALPDILGDADLLRQVFVNLTDNALKFTPPGGGIRLEARAIRSTAEPEGAVADAQWVDVRVTDTGIGIPEAEREKVFEAFYQVDQSSTRKFGGTGLGLAIVRRLVDAHGGTIHVEANSPQGSIFVVTLPVGGDDHRMDLDLPPSSREALPLVFT